MSPLLRWMIDVAVGVHLLLLLVAAVRLWTPREAVNRLLAADLLGVLAISLMLLLALRTGSGLLVDVALGLAAVGFAATILLARYVAWAGREIPKGGEGHE
ncbi:MAG: MrpF/PhaF family protein [Phycisphaeraceae bacterium]